jgi:hypothetical protein
MTLEALNDFGIACKNIHTKNNSLLENEVG